MYTMLTHRENREAHILTEYSENINLLDKVSPIWNVAIFKKSI